MTMPVAAVVLAGGSSRRMGTHNKLIIPDAHGTPMIARTVDAVLASLARPVVVVTGHQPDAIRAALHRRPVRFAHASDHASGLSASLRAGVAAVPTRCRGALICLGDMPLVTPALLNEMVAAHKSSEQIVAPVYLGQRGNPVLWGRSYFKLLNALQGDRGAGGLFDRFACCTTWIASPSDCVVRDFDTLADLGLADLGAN